MYIAMIILYYIVMCLFRIFRMNEYHNINLYQKIHPILLQWLLLTYHLSYQLCIILGISEFYLIRVGNVPNKYFLSLFVDSGKDKSNKNNNKSPRDTMEWHSFFKSTFPLYVDSYPSCCSQYELSLSHENVSGK